MSLIFLGTSSEQDPKKTKKKKDDHTVQVDTTTVSQRDTLMVKQRINLEELKELKEEAKKL